MGDDIQAIKAGILEIADILVINKADHPGVENTERALKSMLELAHPTQRVFQHHGTYMSVAVPETQPDTTLWIPPIQRTISTEGKGISELADAIAQHVAHLTETGHWVIRERARLEVELDALIREAMLERFRATVSQAQYGAVFEKIVSRKLSPLEAVKVLMGSRE
jgi:LAO/AO transport system kinase